MQSEEKGKHSSDKKHANSSISPIPILPKSIPGSKESVDKIETSNVNQEVSLCILFDNLMSHIF